MPTAYPAFSPIRLWQEWSLPFTVARCNFSRNGSAVAHVSPAPKPSVAWSRAEGEGEMTMRTLSILVMIFCFSASAFAQTEASRPTRQVKQAATGCKLVGTVKGTKLWAGDCAPAVELRGTSPMVEPAAPAPAGEANPPAEPLGAPRRSPLPWACGCGTLSARGDRGSEKATN